MDRDCDEGDGLPMISMETWEMIERVKEITREYTENEIYDMLLECEMDLNETVHRLLSPDIFERVKEKRERRKEKKIAEEKRLHDIGSSSDFGDRGGSHHHSENTSNRGESGDSAADEYKRQSIGTGDAISSAQSSQVLQPTCSGARGRASMADIVRRGGPGTRGRASVADIVRRGRPGTRGHVSMADAVGMGGPGANTSSLPIMSTGTSPPLVGAGAVPEQCGVPNTSSLLITLDETCFPPLGIPPLGRTPKRSSYRVTTPFVLPPVEAEPHQDLHSPNPCDTAEMSQDCQPDEVEATVSSEQLAEYSAAVSSTAAGLEKLSMEKGETLSGLPTAHSSLHKLNRLQCELGEASGALVEDSSVGNLDFRNPENHGDEQPRNIPDADRENSASSCASLSSVAHAYSDSLPSFQEPTEYSSGESKSFLQFLEAQVHSSRYSSGGSYSSRPTNFMPEDVRQGTFPVSGLPSQALPSIHITPETTLPRPFALDPDTQHSVSSEHFDNMLAGPSPSQSHANIPSAFQQAHTGEDSSHLLLPELVQDIIQYRNRPPVSHLAQPPAGYGNFGGPTNIPETTLPRPFALDPDTQHSVSLEHFDNMLAGRSPPQSYANIPSAFQQAHTGEDSSHLLLPELLPNILQYRNPAPVSHLAQPPAGYGNFGGPTNIPPAGHRSFGRPTYIPPAGHGSYGNPTHIPPTGHQSFGRPAYIPPDGHGRFGSATYIPPADYGSLGSPSNIPSRFLNNLPASMNLNEFLSSNEGAHFNPHQGGSSASWVHGPGGSRAISPAAGSTHYYTLPEQNQQHPRDEGNQWLLQQHRSQGYQTPDGSQSWDPQGRWPPRHD